MFIQDPQEPLVFTVSELNDASKQLLEAAFPAVWVEGEVSNLSRPASGHLYFSLKDSHAQIRCAFFRSKQGSTAFALKEGSLIRVLARVTLYPERGDYQLVVDALKPAGDGLLRQAYEKLLLELKTAGLFDERHKKAIPFLPSQIGVITSPTGAAIHDILTLLKRRFPALPILIYPTKVQGGDAADEIVKAIQQANHHQQVEVLILARGGGSLEDLWPFNEKRVAYAIFRSEIPIISAVGHETDVTISDFVADLRVPTPSAAAERVVPDQGALARLLNETLSKLARLVNNSLQNKGQKIDWLIRRLRDPAQAIHRYQERLSLIRRDLTKAIVNCLAKEKHTLSEHRRALETLNPLAVLERGYAIARLAGAGPILRSVDTLSPRDNIEVRCAHGTVRCTVDEVVE